MTSHMELLEEELGPDYSIYESTAVQDKKEWITQYGEFLRRKHLLNSASESLDPISEEG